MPFIATCTYCRSSKFRVPFKKRGTFGHCPKCGREFLFVPESGVDVPLMKYNELPFDETEKFDLDGALTEPAQAIADRDPNSEKPEQNPQSIPEQSSDVVSVPIPSIPPSVRKITPDEIPLRFALVAVSLFGLAMFLTLVPYGRLIALPILLAGLVCAVFGWLGLDRHRWLSTTGLVSNALGLFVLVLLPGLLGLSDWVPEPDPEQVPQNAVAVGRDGYTMRPANWVNAAQAVWQIQDVRVSVNRVTIEAFDPNAKKADRSKDRVVRIQLSLSNTGVARAIELQSWHLPPEREVRLTAGGTTLTMRPSNFIQQLVLPQQSQEQTLVFSAPETLQELRLELPASAFGGGDPIRFLIPQSLIVNR